MADTAGSRWRLLVHVPNGVSHTVVPVASETPDPSEWAAEHVVPGEFDEVVAGSWLHVEEMGNDADDGSSTWWMSIAGIVLFVDVAADGSPTGVQFYRPGEYDDPVPEVTYSGMD